MPRRLTRDVPLSRQPAGSGLCGAACARMVAAYHGLKRPLARIADELPVGNGGTISAVVGRWFLEHGFSATVVGHPEDWPNRFIDLSADDARDEIMRWARRQRRSADPSRRWHGQKCVEFLDAGGRFLPRQPVPADLCAPLHAGLPVIMSLDVSFVTRGRERKDPHYVVVTGARNGRLYCNDPYPGMGGRTSLDEAEAFYALARIDGDILIVKPGP